MNASFRRGWTMVEILVSVAIIGILLSLIIAAVQHVREAGRNLHCKNNLKQIGVALQSYHATHGSFPSLAYADSTGVVDGRLFTFTERYTSPFVHLLPYLDRSDIADKVDFRSAGNIHNDVANSNREVKPIVVATFLCPSDSRTFPFLANANYRFCTGTRPKAGSDLRRPESGAFGVFISRKLSEFQDGSMRTALVSERVRGSGVESRLDNFRDFWFTGLSSSTAYRTPTADEVASLCANVVDGTRHDPWMGYSWFNGGYENTWYNHVLPPNASVPDCSVDPFPPAGSPTQAGAFGARSHHAQVNVLHADGSVDGYSASIDKKVWRAIGTVNGND